jgi:PAS domain S-box-containing protein
MERSIILSLLQNAAILLAFSLIYDFLLSKYQNIKNVYVKVLTGLLLGIFGIILILTPWEMMPGIVFDVRSVLLSISGLFFGFIPTIIAMLITGVYRFSLGGSGMWMGIGVILTSGTIGVIWKVIRPGWRNKNAAIELLAMGFVVHIVMLVCTVLLPSEYANNTLRIIFMPVLTLYPLATMFFGLLLIRMSINWQNRKALRESEEKHRILLDESPDPIFSFEPGGKCLYANKAFADGTGKSVDEIIGKNIGEFFSTEDLIKRYAEIKQVFDKGEEKIIEVRVQNNEIDHYFITTITPIKDVNGKVLSAISSSKDITMRKLAEERISILNEELEKKVAERTRELAERTVKLAEEEAALLNLVEDLNLKSEELTETSNNLQLVNKELESFAYTVSHDLRAPLRALDGFAGILLEDYAASLDEEGNRLLRVITDNAKKMGNLIDDLLSFSHLNRQEVRFLKIDMFALANSVYAELVTNSDKEKIKYFLHDIPQAYGDPSMIRQVWVNLISNAIKFSSRKPGQVIEIGCKTEGGENIYFVKDNGTFRQIVWRFPTITLLKGFRWNRCRTCHCPAYCSPPERPGMGRWKSKRRGNILFYITQSK